MKQRAKELDLQKRTQRYGGSKSNTSLSSQSFNPSNDTKYDTTPTPVTYPNNPSPYVLLNKKQKEKIFIWNIRSSIRPGSTGKGMKLGTKGKNVESFVDQLKAEGENVVNNVPVITGAGGATGKAKAQSVPVPDTQKQK